MDIRNEIRQILEQALYSGEATEAIIELLPPDLSEGWLEANAKLRQEIINVHVPEVLAKWLKKNEDYAGQQVFLGRKAQFADINRKFWKLKSAMWDGKAMLFEDELELIDDMIGHLLMARYFFTEKEEPAGGECTECQGAGCYWTEWSDHGDRDPELRKLVLDRPEPADGTVLIKCPKCWVAS